MYPSLRSTLHEMGRCMDRQICSLEYASTRGTKKEVLYTDHKVLTYKPLGLGNYTEHKVCTRLMLQTIGARQPFSIFAREMKEA